MKYKAESILPYNDKEQKSSQVRIMFNNIAPHYDLLNRIMTLGIDKRWRNTAIKKLREYAPERILDIATGTGDLAFLIQDIIHPGSIIGTDLSEGMLDIARQKMKKMNLEKVISFDNQDCMNLTFEDNSFDAVTVSFGVRNFESLEQGFSEIYRVLSPGGVLMVIELSTPDQPIIRQLYKFYSSQVIPFIGRLISSDKEAYTYLPKSIAVVPQGQQMLNIFSRAGFQSTIYHRLTFGACSIYIGEK